MTTTDTAKPAAPTIEAGKAEAAKPEVVTLEQLAREMKVPPRDA